MINSVTAEKARFERMIPLIQKRECEIVALCMDERGVPKNADQILENARRLVKDLEALGVKRARIYLDPLVQAISLNQRSGLIFLDALERIHQEIEGAQTICGLSNISFALPKRSLINRTFLPFLMKAGLSAALLDPLDGELMGTSKAARLLLGEDKYCREYLRSYREGTLDV